MITSEKRYQFIDIIKAIAALLIINSHFDSLYPIKALATGGAIGNALFFCVSGFLLYPIKRDFKSWITPKLLTLYIPTLPLVVLSLLTIKRGELSRLGFIQCFIWPTVFWFVGAIVLFYILYYLLRKIETTKQFTILFIILSIIYAAYYLLFLDTSEWVIESSGLNTTEGYFKLIYYFAIMMMGKRFRINEMSSNYNRMYCAILGVMSIIALYGVKWIMARYPILYHIQFLNQISIVLLVYSVFAFCLAERKKEAISSDSLKKVVLFLGNHTLEMYLTQFIIIHLCERLQFPVNALSAYSFIFVAAFTLKKYSTSVRALISAK